MSVSLFVLTISPNRSNFDHPVALPCVEQSDAARHEAAERARPVRDERDARRGRRRGEDDREEPEQDQLDPRREPEAVEQRRAHDVAGEQVAAEREHRAADPEHGGRGTEQAPERHLRGARERARGDHERVEAKAGRPALDEGADEQQRDGVRDQVADGAVRVHARDEGPRGDGERGRQREESEEADEAQEGLRGADEEDDPERFEGGAHRIPLGTAG